jgi:hypothetical protein
MCKPALIDCVFQFVFSMEKHNGFETEKGGRNGNHGLNGHGTRTLPPDGMYHTSDVTNESGMVDKVNFPAQFSRKK